VELARADLVEEAEAQFAEVVRLRPDLAKAHQYLGLALAKEGKLNQALTEFNIALQLNPTNELARKNIKQLESLKGIGR
jgi:Flp pilus assembly protein TadD